MAADPVKKTRRGRRVLLWLGLALLLTTAAFLLYAADYYRADETALDALGSDGTVRVSRTDYGWFFDGPGETRALIFYPGGKVEETAYAPLLRLLAEQGTDVCLVKMPLRLAVLAPDRADMVLAEHDYESWFIGGHSLGGAMAANYAAEHTESLDGVILLAAYSTEPLPDSLPVLSVYGTEDGVLNRGNYEKNLANVPNLQEVVIEGGNHAQFGSYGEQRGDGEASIDPGMQWNETAEAILEFAGIGE